MNAAVHLIDGFDEEIVEEVPLLVCDALKEQKTTFTLWFAHTNLLLSHLFPLMVRLSDFDVRDQVPTRARVLDVWHGDHQVIEGGALGLFGLTQLFGGTDAR